VLERRTQISKEMAGWRGSKSQNKVGHFQSTMGKQPFLLLLTQSSISLHSKAARLLEYIEEDYIEKELLKKSQI
jgi:hypothetical protein